jgi:LmbE family N-acetylglucosaminyl deacetylase
MFSPVDRVLLLAPHTDDGELGAGATISRLVESGAVVHYVAFSIAEESVPSGFDPDVLSREVIDAAGALGIPRQNVSTLRFPVRRFPEFRQPILEEIVRFRRELRPNLILAPAPSDVHQDHQVVSQEALRAFKTGRLLGYELIWNNIEFASRFAVKVRQVDVERKQRALSAYKSQSGRAYMAPAFVEAHARTRGCQIGSDFAECFDMMRWVTD